MVLNIFKKKHFKKPIFQKKQFKKIITLYVSFEQKLEIYGLQLWSTLGDMSYFSYTKNWEF